MASEHPSNLFEAGGRVISALSGAAQQVPHGLVVFGESGILLIANRRAGAIFGTAPDALVGQPFDQLFPSSDASAGTVDRWQWFRTEAQARGNSVPRRLVAVRHDGTGVPVDIGFRAVDDASRYVVASFVDVTERFELEARLAAVAAEHLEFQRRVSDLAARLAVVTPDALDGLIIDGLHAIAGVLGLDVGVLWRWPIGHSNAVPSHSWTRWRRHAPPVVFPIESIPGIA